jgi:CRISPR-associated protein Csy3
MSNDLKTAEVLAFERKLSNSDGLMYAGKWSDRNKEESWQPIRLQEKAVRGTISNRLKNVVSNDPAKLNAEIQKSNSEKNANLQKVDIAALPVDCDTLKMKFSLRVLGNLEMPSVCNNPEYQKVLARKISTYMSDFQFKTLAERYAENIANGRFLWRNRVGVDSVEVKVTYVDADKKTVWLFDAENFSLRQFSENLTTDLAALSQVIQFGLMGEKPVYLEIESFARLGNGQEIFPSQELVLEKGSNKKGGKSRVLYKVQDIAAMHSQKIGNALRTIDTWYPNAEELGPIAIEPYGAVTTRGAAYRQPKDKADFYSLLDAWMLKDKTPSEEEQHYVMACLIRGGVFGASGKE